ncbi:hypothetical protein ACGC1H_007552 [Rhizoctonia solani]
MAWEMGFDMYACCTESGSSFRAGHLLFIYSRQSSCEGGGTLRPLSNCSNGHWIRAFMAFDQRSSQLTTCLIQYCSWPDIIYGHVTGADSQESLARVRIGQGQPSRARFVYTGYPARCSKLALAHPGITELLSNYHDHWRLLWNLQLIAVIFYRGQ